MFATPQKFIEICIENKIDREEANTLWAEVIAKATEDYLIQIFNEVIIKEQELPAIEALEKYRDKKENKSIDEIFDNIFTKEQRIRTKDIYGHKIIENINLFLSTIKTQYV